MTTLYFFYVNWNNHKKIFVRKLGISTFLENFQNVLLIQNEKRGFH